MDQNILKFPWKTPSNKEFRINPNIVLNPSSNFNRQFFELVQKSDDENEKKNFQGKWQNPNTVANPNTNGQRLFFDVYKQWMTTVKKIIFSNTSYFYEIFSKINTLP